MLLNRQVTCGLTIAGAFTDLAFLSHPIKDRKESGMLDFRDSVLRFLIYQQSAGDCR